MEEHLLQEHYLKYNLRFYWKSQRGGDVWEDLSQSYIRKISNIATYQLDRNTFEAEVLAKNRESPSFELINPITGPGRRSRRGGPPRASASRSTAREVAGRAGWVVDASGRNRFLVRQQKLDRPSPIKHGASFLWVDGLLDPEKLHRPRPQDHPPAAGAVGAGAFPHLPRHQPLLRRGATGSGRSRCTARPAWGWSSTPPTSPARTSRPPRSWSSGSAASIRSTPATCRSGRSSTTPGSPASPSTAARPSPPSSWALVGEACRFTDPLYSPGGDLISIYNTLIADAILTRDRQELEAKVRLYEPLARAIYEAYVPSFAVSYCTLGDQECFSLRYVWELTVYFAFYVFPFINDLHTDRRFLPGFLRRFGQLGPINQGMHRLLAAYYRWKKENVVLEAPEPVFFDFMEVGALALGRADLLQGRDRHRRGPRGARRAAREPPRPGPLDRRPRRLRRAGRRAGRSPTPPSSAASTSTISSSIPRPWPRAWRPPAARPPRPTPGGSRCPAWSGSAPSGWRGEEAGAGASRSGGRMDDARRRPTVELPVDGANSRRGPEAG